MKVKFEIGISEHCRKQLNAATVAIFHLTAKNYLSGRRGKAIAAAAAFPFGQQQELLPPF